MARRLVRVLRVRIRDRLERGGVSALFDESKRDETRRVSQRDDAAGGSESAYLLDG